MINLHPVAGAGQIITGTTFQPFAARVTDFSIPPNAVLGANVTFHSTVLRPTGNGLDTTQSVMPVILSETQSTVQSDVHGMASFVPSVGAFTGTLEINIQVSAGITAALETLMQAFPSGTGGNTSLSNTDLWHRGVPAAGRTLRQLGNDDR